MPDTPLELLNFPVRCGYCGAGPFHNGTEVDEHITEEHLPEAVWEFATSNMEEVLANRIELARHALARAERKEGEAKHGTR